MTEEESSPVWSISLEFFYSQDAMRNSIVNETDGQRYMGKAETTTFEVVKGAEVQHMPDGYVVYQEERDKVHYVNPVAAIVYELCGANQSISSMTAYLKSEFSLDEPPMEAVEDCVAKLVEEGLIIKCEG